jgi:hypothetical protein
VSLPFAENFHEGNISGRLKKMLALDLQPVKKTGFFYCLTLIPFIVIRGNAGNEGGNIVAEVTIEDGIIRVKELDIQDGKAVKVLEEYPEARWPEITRRALKIGLGYLKGGAQD